MISLWVTTILIFLTIFTIKEIYAVPSGNDFPGVIELVGYNNNRMGRMNRDSFKDTEFHGVTRQMNKERDDIERVKQNIEEYNKLLKVDTSKLNSQQKDMLKKIVARVARLKETFDLKDDQKLDISTSAEPEMTTMLPKIMNNIDSTTTLTPSTQSIPISTSDSSSTIIPTTIEQMDQSEARSNPNLNIGNRNVNKGKVRQNTTKRPMSSTKPTTKRTTGHKLIGSKQPITGQSVTASNLSGMTIGQKIPITTIQPQTIKQNQKQQQQLKQEHDVLMQQNNNHHNQRPDDIIEEKTIPMNDHRQSLPPPNVGSGIMPAGATAGINSDNSDLMYDSNVTASSIIDSLANHAREDYYNNREPLSESNKEKKPVGTAKPTKYHYYPHNQHIYLLPECAIQQVCNAVYVRLNYTQPLCACPSRYRDPCSASLNEDDQHTTKLIGDGRKKAITLAKTCEATTEMRECRSPKDWSLLALQNTRTGKSHYLVICRCPDHFKLEGPMAHDQPTYASVPGIRVFGMMCVKPGYAVRRPSVQPPKRYQLQKPYYMPNSNKYSSNKDTRPNYQQQQESYQSQHQANYQYLNRPESTPIINSQTDFPESLTLNTFGGVYGRNNERNGEPPVEAEEGSGDDTNGTSKREKRSNLIENVDDMPELPWHRIEEFQRSIIWD